MQRKFWMPDFAIYPHPDFRLLRRGGSVENHPSQEGNFLLADAGV